MTTTTTTTHKLNYTTRPFTETKRSRGWTNRKWSCVQEHNRTWMEETWIKLVLHHSKLRVRRVTEKKPGSLSLDFSCPGLHWCFLPSPLIESIHAGACLSWRFRALRIVQIIKPACVCLDTIVAQLIFIDIVNSQDNQQGPFLNVRCEGSGCGVTIVPCEHINRKLWLYADDSLAQYESVCPALDAWTVIGASQPAEKCPVIRSEENTGEKPETFTFKPYGANTLFLSSGNHYKMISS